MPALLEERRHGNDCGNGPLFDQSLSRMVIVSEVLLGDVEHDGGKGKRRDCTKTEGRYGEGSDPGKVSGDSKTADNIVKGTRTPTPPAKALEYFSPLVRTGTETCTVPWIAEGTVTDGYTVMENR